MCGICNKFGLNLHDPVLADLSGATSAVDGALDFQLDQFGGQGFSFRGKPIFALDRVIEQIDAGRSVPVSNGVITYTFLDLDHLTGIYNNPNYGFGGGLGLSAYSAEQRDQARLSIEMWDDLIAPTFRESKGLGADIQFANSADPAQAYAYYPGNGPKYQSDVFTADPVLNPTNNWFTYGGYGTTTLVHELGHTLGLSHPGAYNFDPAVPQTYVGLAEYAQDSTQYSIMSYWGAGETGARGSLTGRSSSTPMPRRRCSTTSSRSRPNMAPIRPRGLGTLPMASTPMRAGKFSTSARIHIRI